MNCEVIVLFDGYSTEFADGIMKANCSCVLIKCSKLIIVDTMTAWDGKKIIQALASYKLKPEDIDYVICTHSHADHIGNNNLFLNAEHIVGYCVHKGETFYENNIKNESYNLTENVKIVATPGHTTDDITVFVQTIIDGKIACVAITGDLFEKKEDIENPLLWKSLGMPELQKTQSQMRAFVISESNFIIPGHGPMFIVTDNMRKLVRAQIIK
ncbi:metallo-beta-lactamase domain-containing protein 1 [Prorops nasuta]|uniref:metallo-beta-lactamase domain-containing protein 1 n=1 Tax=Prorops nasuta TaxID=863751 RepID=UPI0034CE5235